VADRERVLALLHELEGADAEKGVLLEELDRLANEIETVRGRAHELEDFEATLPWRRNELDAELARTSEEEDAAQAALAEAEGAARTAKEDRKADARRFEVRARDRLSVAQRRRAEAVQAAESLEQEVRAAREGAGKAEECAHALARELRDRPRLAEDAGADPGPGLSGIVEWGETARAALFVARGQLAAERDAVIRQANEAGAAALGEPLTSSGAALVARRVERALE